MHHAPLPSPAEIDAYLEGSPLAARLESADRPDEVVRRIAEQHSVHAYTFDGDVVFVECGTLIRTDGYYPADVVAVQVAIALGY